MRITIQYLPVDTTCPVVVKLVPMPKPMTLVEMDDFRKLDKVVKEGLETTIAVGAALKKIRDGELWRGAYSSFEDYCSRRLEMSRSWAYQLMSAHSAIESLPKKVADQVNSASAAVELATVPEPDRSATVQRAATTTGTATAKAIRQSAKPPEPLDCLGIPIPKERMPLWERRDYVKQIGRLLDDAKRTLNQAVVDEDILFTEVNLQQCLTDIGRLSHDVERALPFCVCPICQGRKEVACALCKGRGMISQYLWNSPVIPKATKALHLKQSRTV